MQPIVIRKLDDAQKKRLKNHEATVTENLDGSLQFFSEKIITPKGLEKTNRRIAVLPKDGETVEQINSAKDVFKDLAQMNVILTNACNLSCSYCYEQHNRDFGRFTNESLLKSFKFLNDISHHPRKVFQFFGGEPLIHKDLILGFLKENKEYLEDAYNGFIKTSIGCVTNGLLLTPEFLQEYLGYHFTVMMISLDTDKAEIDYREIGQEKIDKLIHTIKHDIPQAAKDRNAVVMRLTLSEENAEYFVPFIDRMMDAGIRTFVVHPLVLDSRRGFIKWDDDRWDNLHKDILHVLDKYEHIEIHFAEGVGQKGEENCMIGSDMIAIDGSGDFSGCYFFTNQKANGADSTILGNIFEDRVYTDRYKTFSDEYAKMFEEEEQCKKCDYKNACYQCPAGNLDTGSKRMFRPDDMCQKIVKLYVDLQEDITKKQFTNKIYSIKKATNEYGEQKIFTKAVLHLMYKHLTNIHASPEQTEKTFELFPDYEQLIGVWKFMKENMYKSDKTSYNDIVDVFKNLYNSVDKVSVKEMYEYLTDSDKSKQIENIDLDKRIGYLALIHLVILNNENKAFKS